MEKSKYKIQQRDWVYILILSIVGQFIIYFLAFVYNSSASALGYVSFAGTMVSIILAVIAIGYTYGESIRQKHNEDELIIQIRGLAEIKNKLGDQVNILEGIASLERSFNTKLNESHEWIKENLEKYSVSKPSNGIVDQPLNSENILNSTNYMFDIYTLILHKIFNNHDISNFNEFPDILFEYFKSETNNDQIVFTKFEAAMAVWSILVSIGLISNLEFTFDVKKFYKGKYSEVNLIRASELKNLIKKL